MTLLEAETAYSKYVPNGATGFTDECNDLMRRFFDSGKWNGLVTEIEVATPGALITLAAGYESILAAQLDGSPVSVYARYHEFLPGGPGEIENESGGVAFLIDNGDRTYKVVGTRDYEEARLTVKRRFVALEDDTDDLPIDNPAALKLGFMSLNYETAGQLDLADQYFQRALQALNGELKEARGGAQSVFQASPHGFWLGRVKAGY